MVDRIGGWNVNGLGAGGIALATKPAQANGQHVIYSLDLSFSAAPAGPILWELIDGATSPGTVLASGFVTVGRSIDWPAGICVLTGHAVTAVLHASGIAAVNLHGATR